MTNKYEKTDAMIDAFIRMFIVAPLVTIILLFTFALIGIFVGIALVIAAFAIGYNVATGNLIIDGDGVHSHKFEFDGHNVGVNHETDENESKSSTS